MNKIGEREQLLWQTIGLIIRALTHHDLYSCLFILLGLSRDSDLLQYLGRLVLVQKMRNCCLKKYVKIYVSEKMYENTCNIILKLKIIV